MARELGGSVESNDVSEFGKTELGARVDALPRPARRADGVDEPPRLRGGAAAGATVTASSPVTPVAAFEDPARALYGVQFHPEVVHAARPGAAQELPVRGRRRRARVDAAAVIEEQVERIRAQVGRERVICGLSGGVDSAVAALLVHKAVGDQLTCVFVDHGLLRENEAAQVVETFGGHFHVPLVHVDAPERFLTRLARVTDPETKRKIVGEEFIRVFEEARKLGDVRFLVQGTLYSDVMIESGGEVGVAADQVPSQRRRASRRHADGAGGAVASCSRTRSAAGRRGSASPSGSSGAVRSRGRPRDPDHRRGHSRAARASCVRPTRSCWRRCAA